MPNGKAPETLTDILDAFSAAGENGQVTVRAVVDEIGDLSFAPALLVPALILISPLSGVPGLPTMGAIIMLLIEVQALMGRKHLWLPEFLMRRQISEARFQKAVGWLRRPVGWVDAQTRRRLVFLARKPASFVALGLCMLTTVIIPALELLPMVTTVGATAIALMSLGLMVRDGLFILLGYAVIGLFVYTIYMVV